VIVTATCKICGHTVNVDAEDNVRNVIHPDVDKQVAEIKARGLCPNQRILGEGTCGECARKKPVN
jgi:hypothetical protein